MGGLSEAIDNIEALDGNNDGQANLAAALALCASRLAEQGVGMDLVVKIANYAAMNGYHRARDVAADAVKILIDGGQPAQV